MTFTGILAYLTALTAPPAHFRFPLGTDVQWAGSPDVRWQIVMRRYTESRVSEAVEYLVRRPDAPTTDPQWTFEADLAAW